MLINDGAPRFMVEGKSDQDDQAADAAGGQRPVGLCSQYQRGRERVEVVCLLGGGGLLSDLDVLDRKNGLVPRHLAA